VSDTERSPRRRRRGNANETITISWRDIPAQVNVTFGGEKGSWLLEERFQKAIDNAATVAGLTDADDYVLEWRRASSPCMLPDGADPATTDPENIARIEAERLQELYPRDRLRQLVADGGLESDDPNQEEST
jgi:hypothetical protein